MTPRTKRKGSLGKLRLVDDVAEFLKTSLQLEEAAFKIAAVSPMTYRPIAEVVVRNLRERQERWSLLAVYDDGDDYSAFLEALNSLTKGFTAARRKRMKEKDAK